MESEVIIKFNREEAMACAISLAAVKKPYGWQQDALAKVDKALGFNQESEVLLMEEKEICPECEDGWMVKDGEKYICSHCGHEIPID